MSLEGLIVSRVHLGSFHPVVPIKMLQDALPVRLEPLRSEFLRVSVHLSFLEVPVRWSALGRGPLGRAS